jgi:hypothetical protein
MRHDGAIGMTDDHTHWHMMAGGIDGDGRWW